MTKFEKKQTEIQSIVDEMLDLFQKSEDVEFGSKFSKLDKRLQVLKKEVESIREKEGKTFRIQAQIISNLTFNVKAVSEADARSQIKKVIGALQFQDLEFSVDHELSVYDIDPVNEEDWIVKQ